jgi:NitT/TauT family transport system substrate-binding protein
VRCAHVLFSALALMVAGACQGISGPALAEVSEIKIARQYGLTYLPLMVQEDQKLVEKHAKEAGLADLKVGYVQISSSAGMSDALLSGSAQIASGGIHNQLVLWDKTKGGVLGFAGIAVYDSYLLCTDPAIKGIRDLTDKHRIAVPSVKISPQAIQLQMAAAREWGIENFGKLDALTVSRAHPDSVAAMISRGTEVNCYVSNPPYTERLLREKGINKVASTSELIGVDRETRGMVYAMVKFTTANPKVTAVFTKALAEANAFLKSDPRRAAETYLRISGDKESVDTIHEIITKPDFQWTATPYGFMRNADFLHKIGLMKTKPANLADLFMPGTDIAGGH